MLIELAWVVIEFFGLDSNDITIKATNKIKISVEASSLSSVFVTYSHKCAHQKLEEKNQNYDKINLFSYLNKFHHCRKVISMDLFSQQTVK